MPIITSYIAFNYVGKVIVKCAQDGKWILTEVNKLANFEGLPPLPHELVRGKSLLVEREGKSYPVVSRYVCLHI